MFLLPTAICCIIFLIISYKVNKKKYLINTIIFCVAGALISTIIYGIVISSKTRATEVWSGRVLSVEHKEEYSEVVVDTHSDGKGHTYTTTRVVHHPAENYINTSDNGGVSVYKSLNGEVRFDDSFPNTSEELEKIYPVNTPTASTHTYKNKVQSSYSIYKHKEINLKEYEDLPEYPLNLKNDIQIDRFLGEIKNKDKILDKVNEINSDLNSKINNKQVNLILVNLGDKPENYGFALQDYWNGGNKNDFVICFSSSGNKINWVYPFSWADSEKSEKLKIDVRNYMTTVNLDEDFSKHLDNIGNIIKENFERKEFADFNYLTVELPLWSYILITILNIAIGYVILGIEYDNRCYSNRRW